MDLRRGINLAVEHVLADLKKRAKMISTTEEIAQVPWPDLVVCSQLTMSFHSNAASLNQHAPSFHDTVQFLFVRKHAFPQ